MRPTFADAKGWERAFFIAILIFFGLFFVLFFLEDAPPARRQNFFAAHSEQRIAGLPEDRRCGKFAIRIKDCNEAACDQVVYVLLFRQQVVSRLPCRNDGVVVSYLRRVENFLSFEQLLAAQRLE